MIMKKFGKAAASLATAALSLTLTLAAAMPVSAAFDQSVLDGVILIYSGAPDSSGKMEYWRGTGFFVGEEGDCKKEKLSEGYVPTAMWWKNISRPAKPWAAANCM